MTNQLPKRPRKHGAILGTLAVLFYLIGLAWAGFVIFVAVHFARKYW